jgi:hypothetical protein
MILKGLTILYDDKKINICKEIRQMAIKNRSGHLYEYQRLYKRNRLQAQESWEIKLTSTVKTSVGLVTRRLYNNKFRTSTALE